MPYIKSHSNFVLKKRHQGVNDGTIYERDITTIGGRNNFSKGQVPLYQSGNFVITVNNDDNVQKSFYTDGWEKNDNNEIWTLENIEGLVKDETASEDEKIVLKQNYYNLRDFAYFGSCSELVRASISDILKKYPGELFAPYDNTTVSAYTYDDTQMVLTSDGTTSPETVTLTGETSDPDEFNYYKENHNGKLISTSVVGGIPVFYYDRSKFNGGAEESVNTDENGNSKIGIKRLGGESKFLLDNPFNIDIHTTQIKDSEITDENSLKYFANDGYKQYEVIDNEGKGHDFTWSVANFIVGVDSEGHEIYAGNGQFSVNPTESTILPSEGGQNLTSTMVTSINEDDGSHHFCLGNQIAEITITLKDKDLNGESFTIEAWVGDKNRVYYLIDLEKNPQLLVKNGKDTVIKYRLRPRVYFMKSFMKKLDVFEKILMDEESSPKYTAVFNVIRENEFGYYTELERMTFPTTYGGYNIGSSGPAFDNYVSNLADIAEFYDERFCDNMYRSMTHESIKNFDWTYLRHRTDEDEEDVKQSADKIAKIIRLFGRQFDEILAYIDNIKNYNVVTYNNINNLPDYFFTDTLNTKGWDINQIIPYSLFEYVEAGEIKFYINPTESGVLTNEANVTTTYVTSFNDKPTTGNTLEDVSDLTSESDEKTNKYKGKTLHRIFTPDTSFKVKPYTKNLDPYGDGYFFGCLCDKKYHHFDSEGDGKFYADPTDSGELTNEATVTTTYITSVNDKLITGNTYVDCSDILRIRIKNYTSENEWTMPRVNTEFMKRLILNSNNIWRHKGTQEGVEMILGMFGMKSKRWYDSLPEYEKETYKWNFKNNLHIRSYDYEIKEYTSFTKRIEDPYIKILGDYKYNWINKSKKISYGVGEDSPYQGIPVTYRDTHDGKRYLYPNFQKYEIYDGNPYYQMNGGWLSVAPYLFDKDNNLIVKKEDNRIFNETLRNIKSVDSLQDLFEIPLQELTNGDIVHVVNITGKYAVVDGRVYPLEEESDGGAIYKYFTVEVVNGSVIIGNAYFNDYVIVSDPYSVDSKRRYSLANGESDGSLIKVYLIKRENISGDSIYAYSDGESVSTFTVFKNEHYMEGTGFTNYFRINDTLYSNELSPLGWEQLKQNDYDFYRVNSEKDYYKGNNPHTGHFHYDNGHEYFTYFRHLFRYAYNNSLFEESVLSEYPVHENEDLYSEIGDFGFRSLVNDDSCQLDYDDFLTEDSKIHYFGNYYNDKGVHHYTLNEKPSNGEYNLSTINPETTTIKPVEGGTVGYGWMHKPCGENEVEGKVPIDGMTNQIVNNKVIKIIFYIRDNNFYSKTALEEIKYLESVVVPYMTQLIPSGAILGTEYRYVGQNVHSYTIKTTVNGEPTDGLGVEIFNEKTQKWELVGYTEQGVLTFEREGNMGNVKVRISGGTSEEASIEASDYYFSADYMQTAFEADVTTTYKKINFDKTEGEVEPDGCLEFEGNMFTNPDGKYYTYEVVYENTGHGSSGWLEVDDAIYRDTLTVNGGKLGFGVLDNNTLDDRDAKIIVKYKPSDTLDEVKKELIIHQYPNTEYVTYTVISNVNDGVEVTFTNPSTNVVEYKAQFKNGVVEYSKPKISAGTLKVQISGGLPTESSHYTLKTADGSVAEIINNAGQTDWSAPLVFNKFTTRYTWDDAINVADRVYKDKAEFSIQPDETVERDYNIMAEQEAPLSETHCLVSKPSVSWLSPSTKDERGTHFLNVKENKNNNDREATVRYYIKEDPSVFLDYKVKQTEGVYTFLFTEVPGKDKINITNGGKRAKVETDFTKHVFNFSLDFVSSYSNTPDNKVPYIVSVNKSTVKYTIDDEYLHLDLPKNICTKSNSFTVTFIQRGSNKRIILTVVQSAVVCDVGDVYFYNPSSGLYYFADIMHGDSIEKSWKPIGVTVIPMNNGLFGESAKFARLISLTEQNSEEYNGPWWKKENAGESQRTHCRYRIPCDEEKFESGHATIGTEPYNGRGVMQYKNKYSKNGLYYSNTDRHASRIMERNADGVYKVTTEFASDVIGTYDGFEFQSGLADFNGFKETREALAQTSEIGPMYQMCDNYEPSGTKKGEWYVGGAGEMACLVQNIGLINAVLAKLKELNYPVSTLHVDFAPADSYFKSSPDNGTCFVDYYWTITNKGRVKRIGKEGGSDPGIGGESASWAVLLSNGTIQWAIHRAGLNQSSYANHVRMRVRPMLLVNRDDKHTY